MSMQCLKEYKEIFIFTLTLLTQNITTNQCKHWPFLLILYLYFNKYAAFTGIQAKYLFSHWHF